MENTLATGLLVTGAALAATGVVLVFLNEPRLVDDAPPGSRMTVIPSVGRHGAGLTLSWDR